MTMPISRREFLARSALGAAALAGGCRAGARGASRLVITDPGGEWQQAAIEAYYRPFRSDTGIEVVYSARPALALGKLKAMAEAGNVEWDLTILADYLSHRAAAEGLIDPITVAVDPASLVPGALLPHFVGNDVFSTVIAYDTRKWPVGRGPRTMAEFWDVRRFPGRRAVGGIAYGPLEFALLADGVPRERIYPLDVDRALRRMSQLAPQVTVWWTTGAQQSQLMLTGEVDLIIGWNARLQAAIDQGAPFVIEWNQGMYQFEGWVSPRGAPNPAAAARFVEYALQPDRQAEFARRLAYGPVHRDAFPRLDPARAALLPTHPSNLGRMFPVDAAWVAGRVDDLQNRWTQWRVA